LAKSTPMMIIDKATVSATRQKIADPKKISQAIKDVRKMLEIKEALLWRSEGMAPCCGSLSNISAHLTREVGILKNTLSALENNNTAHATDLLQEYLNLLDTSCEASQPDYC
jgi:transcriptional regulator with XRE-family HTH domain